jgi:hypothetical protein
VVEHRTATEFVLNFRCLHHLLWLYHLTVSGWQRLPARFEITAAGDVKELPRKNPKVGDTFYHEGRWRPPGQDGCKDHIDLLMTQMPDESLIGFSEEGQKLRIHAEPLDGGWSQITNTSVLQE